MINEDFESNVNDQGIVEEFHRKTDHTIHITYYSKSVAGPLTQPMYSCWVEMKDGRKSKELNIDENLLNVYPLLSRDVWNRITDFVDAVPV